MILYHFTEKPFILDFDRSYYQDLRVHKAYRKPDGLWLSDEKEEMSWSQWCKKESFQLENLIYKTKIKLNTEKILIIKSVIDMLVFNDNYFFKDSIKWEAVAKDYKGIVITPYFWELRLHKDFFWYYPWDCASGCIWDLSAIKNKQNLISIQN
jgi:hypothetical protein